MIEFTEKDFFDKSRDGNIDNKIRDYLKSDVDLLKKEIVRDRNRFLILKFLKNRFIFSKESNEYLQSKLYKSSRKIMEDIDEKINHVIEALRIYKELNVTTNQSGAAGDRIYFFNHIDKYDDKYLDNRLISRNLKFVKKDDKFLLENLKIMEHEENFLEDGSKLIKQKNWEFLKQDKKGNFIVEDSINKEFIESLGCDKLLRLFRYDKNRNLLNLF